MKTYVEHIPEHDVTTITYSYDELSPDAQKKVEKWYLDGIYPDDFIEYWEFEQPYLYGITGLNIQFSLNYQQGDGVNVYGELYFDDCRELLKSVKLNDFTDKEWKRIEFYFDQCGYSISIPRNNTHYTYDYSRNINFANDWISQLEWYRIRDIDEKLIYKLEKLVKQAFHIVNKEMEEIGYDFFYEIPEDFYDYCDSNGWEFLEDGTLYEG